MNAQYIPLANSPSLADNFESKEQLYPSKSPRRSVSSGLAGILTKHLTRARCFLLVPLLILPVLYHILLLRLANDLEPEIPNEWFQPGNVDKHNAAVISSIHSCREQGILRDTTLPNTAETEVADLKERGCGSKAMTVIILASKWFREAYEGRNTLPEAMYAQSTISALNALGYSYVFTSTGMEDTTASQIAHMWDRLPGNVRMIWADSDQITACARDPTCLKTAENEAGIDAWRFMTFSFDKGSATNPLGPEWTLSPHPSADVTPFPYSIEPVCRRLTPLSQHDRVHPPQAYLFAQESQDLVAPNFAWSVPYFKHLNQQLGIQIVTAFRNDDQTLASELLNAKVTNVGAQSNIKAYRMIRDSFVLIGSGGVHTPISPWEALCLAVPVINPILEWDDEVPTDRSKWKTQHPELAHLSTPYVYHIRQHDVAGLKNALRSAVATPIGPFVPASMRFETVNEAIREVIEGDWKGRAQALL